MSSLDWHCHLAVVGGGPLAGQGVRGGDHGAGVRQVEEGQEEGELDQGGKET